MNTAEEFYVCDLCKQNQHLKQRPHRDQKLIFDTILTQAKKKKHRPGKIPNRQHNPVHTPHHQQLLCKYNTQTKTSLRSRIT
jgi:hypothetical protein